jgi:hypothetical protein
MASQNYMDYRKLKSGSLWTLPDVEAKKFFLGLGGSHGVAGPTNRLQRYVTDKPLTPAAEKARESFDWPKVVDRAANDVVVCLEKVKTCEKEFAGLPKFSVVELERHEGGELLSGWKNSASFRFDDAVSPTRFHVKLCADPM